MGPEMNNRENGRTPWQSNGRAVSSLAETVPNASVLLSHGMQLGTGSEKGAGVTTSQIFATRRVRVSSYRRLAAGSLCRGNLSDFDGSQTST
jgi:hypothetical protein